MKFERKMRKNRVRSLSSVSLASFIVLLVVLSSILISGCIAIQVPEEIAGGIPISEKAELNCISLCHDAKENGTDLTAGPCLSNEIVEDWVCDVAHDPRQAIDNLPENQCSAFRQGLAHHFVEVDENCELIKKY